MGETQRHWEGRGGEAGESCKEGGQRVFPRSAANQGAQEVTESNPLLQAGPAPARFVYDPPTTTTTSDFNLSHLKV